MFFHFRKILFVGGHFQKCIFAEGSFNQKPLAFGENSKANLEVQGPLGDEVTYPKFLKSQQNKDSTIQCDQIRRTRVPKSCAPFVCTLPSCQNPGHLLVNLGFWISIFFRLSYFLASIVFFFCFQHMFGNYVGEIWRNK